MKPGGLSFHYVEVDGRRGVNSWAKKYPELYRKYFIEQDGHYGLENYVETLRRFEKNGFSLLKKSLLVKIFVPPIEICKRFDNEYKEKSLAVKIAANVACLLSRSKWVTMLLGIVLKPLQMVLEPLVPDDFGGLMLVIYKKV